MFRKIGPYVVQSDEGISLRIIHPEIIEYREKNKIYEIGLGYNPEKRKIYIYASNSISSQII